MTRSRLAEPLVMLATVVQWLVLAMFTGAVVGVGCTIFLRALFASEGRLYDASWWLLAGLLLAGGFANGLLLHYGYRISRSGYKDSPIVAVNEQHGRMPFRTLWIKPLAALITLACGGSAGKEGPCSHIGASFAAGIGRIFHLNPELRKRLLACGVSAGFASVFGTPIAGAIYGVEMLAIGRIRHDFLFPGIVAGVTAFQVSKYLGVPYPDYHIAFTTDFTEIMFLKTVLIGILCGVAAWCFVEMLQQVKRLFEAAFLIIGHRSVYPSQQIAFSKSSWIFARADLPVGQEKVRLSYGLLRWWSKHRRGKNKDGSQHHKKPRRPDQG